jgi:hypothetical protein
MDPDETAIAEEADDSAEEILEQAQRNAQALVMATVAFLIEQGMTLDDWATSVGRTFAKAWDYPHAWDADEFLDAMLINYRSLGAEVISSVFGSDQAEAVTTGFPDPELCGIFGVEPSSAARYNDAAGEIARQCGLTWEWHLADGQTRYLVSRDRPG